jgi:hypothetical protein
MAMGGHGPHEVLPGPALPCPLFPVGGSSLGGLTIALGVAYLQGERPAAVSFPLGQPTLCACVNLLVFNYLPKHHHLDLVFHPGLYIMGFRLPILI